MIKESNPLQLLNYDAFNVGCFSMKIGRITYDVETHFCTDGRQTILRQFSDYILKSGFARTLDFSELAAYDESALAVPDCQKGA